MTKQDIKRMHELIKEIETGKPGIILVINEELVADYGNDMDAETLFRGLEIYGRSVESEVGDSILSKKLEA